MLSRMSEPAPTPPPGDQFVQSLAPQIELTFAAAPTPGAAALLAVGGFAATRRRRA